MSLAFAATFSTCQRGQTASILVRGIEPILPPRFNGAPSGIVHCNTLPEPEPGKCICIHAERNSLNHAARIGTRVSGAALYTIMRPCISCASDIVQAEIAAVHYMEDYHTDKAFEYVRDMFKESNILFFDYHDLYYEQIRIEYLAYKASLGMWTSMWKNPLQNTP